MEVIRKKIKRNGRNKITIELPEDFKAENLEVIIRPDLEEKSSEEKKEHENEMLREKIRKYYSKFNVDLSNFKFNIDELYDR